MLGKDFPDTVKPDTSQEKIFLQLEDACTDGNQELIKQILAAIKSDEQKKQALLKIVECYEDNGLFPVGYSLLLIKLLIQMHDLKSANEQIIKCLQRGVPEKKILKIVYDYVIKPDESFYQERFNNNLKLLRENRIVFPDHVNEFDQIKKKVSIIAGSRSDTPDGLLKTFDADERILIINITSAEAIKNILKTLSVAYLLYDDLKKFYYMLLFEDFSQLYKYLKQNRIVIFDGREKRVLIDFFSDLRILNPSNCIGALRYKKYAAIIDEVNRLNEKKVRSIIESLNEYYKDMDFHYYRNLFKMEPSGIKVMLITSEHTDINKFITRNWCDAFLKLGYQAKLITEGSPCEHMTTHFIYKELYDFKPDIVFYINITISSVLVESEIRKNLLWIMRYRDLAGCELNHAQTGYEYNNMFILPLIREWAEQIVNIGVPENRTLHTFDGVNINVFKKRDEISGRYAADIVSVNNAVGREDFAMDYYLKKLSIEDERVKKEILKEIERVKGMIANNNVIFSLPDYGSIVEMLNEKLASFGRRLSGDGKKYIENLLSQLMDILSREKIIEWIIESGITKNIQLWGQYWSHNEKFRKYHMGVAQHGEELSAIYGSSKISISDSQAGFFHERNFEIFASGGFPLIRHVKSQAADRKNETEKYFKENEDFVLFYSRDDLLDKIRYYLENQEKRGRIAEKGRKIVIENFSHLATVRKTMDFIKNYYN